MSHDRLDHGNPRVKSQPRTHGTPSGYRNVRVLVNQDLHYRLAAFSGLSHMSIQEFVIAWLTLSTPIDPATGQPLPADSIEGAPGRRQGPDALASPGPGPGATTTSEGAARGPAANSAPGAGAARPQGATSDPDRIPDASLATSSPTAAPLRPQLGQDHDGAQAGGHQHV
jgi:hypothetical protein